MPILSMLMSGLGGGIVSLGSSIFGAVTSALTGLFSAVSSIVTQGFQMAIGLVQQGISAFVSLLQMSLASLRDFAQNVTSLSNKTGMSTGQSLKVTESFRAGGMDAATVSRIFSAPGMDKRTFDMRATALGAPTTDSSNISVELIKWFQSESDFSMREAKMKSLFGDNVDDSLRNFLNQDPNKVQENVSASNTLRDSLGLTPEVIQRTSQGLEMLISRFTMFKDFVLQKIGAEMLPMLETILSVVSDFFVANASKIGTAIQTAGRWMFVDMPGLVMNGARAVIDWGAMVANTLLGITEVGGEWVDSLRSKNGAFYTVVNFLAGVLDFVIDMFSTSGAMIRMAMDSVETAIAQSPFAGIAKAAGFEFEDHGSDLDILQNQMNQVKWSGVQASLQKSNGFFKDEAELKTAADERHKGEQARRAWVTNTQAAGHNVIDGIEKLIGNDAERAAKYDNGMKGVEKAVRESGDKVANAVTSTSANNTQAAFGHIGASIALRTRRRGA